MSLRPRLTVVRPRHAVAFPGTVVVASLLTVVGVDLRVTVNLAVGTGPHPRQSLESANQLVCPILQPKVFVEPYH
jgi:hypothetical protein